MANKSETASSKSPTSATGDSGAKLGLFALIAIVVGSMLGGGVFSLPQNTAASSAIGPVLIAWVIAGIGISLLLMRFAYYLIYDLIFKLVCICTHKKVLDLLLDLMWPGDIG